MPDADAALLDLAAMAGVRTEYADIAGETHVPGHDALLAVLQSLGIAAQHEADVAESAHRLRQQAVDRVVPRTLVVRAGSPYLGAATAQTDATAHCTFTSERGARIEWDISLVAGTPGDLNLPGPVTEGYHHLEVETGGRVFHSFVIASPGTAFAPDARGWGLFAPTYALRREPDSATGTYRDLATFCDFTADAGGSVVGTLPLLPTFLDTLYNPSPYSPVSRRMWSEFYLDTGNGTAGGANAPGPLVDYASEMRARRAAMQPHVDAAFNDAGEPVDPVLARFLLEHPLVGEYARFRAACDRQRTPWRAWPVRMQQGELLPTDYAEDDRRFYAWAQWQAHSQLAGVTQHAASRGVKLYLDLPVGAHPDGFDTWQDSSVFALTMNVGAPPDPLGPNGQDWGFPPLIPAALEAQEYRHIIEVIRHHLRYAGMLRIDHVMGFNRLFWIPHGMPASEGIYVSYPAEALYAILAIESQRHHAAIVGEDLGTVPDEVRTIMEAHRTWRMYVAAFEFNGWHTPPLPPAPATAMASLNTHDTPPFATFLERLADEQPAAYEALIAQMQDAGLLAAEGFDASDIAAACLSYLARGDAPMVLANTEDLWAETASQNVPGTTDEHPNWQRRFRLSLAEMEHDPHIAALLQQIAAQRPAAHGNGGPQ